MTSSRPSSGPTPIRFDVAVPGDLPVAPTWHNQHGEQRTLKYVVDGRLERSVSLQVVYRLTDESAAGLSALPISDRHRCGPAFRHVRGAVSPGVYIQAVVRDEVG
jgi:hypothetical protein